MNKKLKEAIKNKNLIDFDEIFNSYSEKRKAEILKRARYIRAAMALRKLRRQLGLSQEKLAQKMNTKREFIARAESGRQNITLETLYRVAEATGKDFQFRFE